jgi:hypothetical protein
MRVSPTAMQLPIDAAREISRFKESNQRAKDSLQSLVLSFGDWYQRHAKLLSGRGMLMLVRSNA